MHTVQLCGKGGKSSTTLTSNQRYLVNKYTKTDDFIPDRSWFQQNSMHPDPETYSGRGTNHHYDNVSRTNTKEVGKKSWLLNLKCDFQYNKRRYIPPEQRYRRPSHEETRATAQPVGPSKGSSKANKSPSKMRALKILQNFQKRKNASKKVVNVLKPVGETKTNVTKRPHPSPSSQAPAPKRSKVPKQTSTNKRKQEVEVPRSPSQGAPETSW